MRSRLHRLGLAAAVAVVAAASPARAQGEAEHPTAAELAAVAEELDGLAEPAEALERGQRTEGKAVVDARLEQLTSHFDRETFSAELEEPYAEERVRAWCRDRATSAAPSSPRRSGRWQTRRPSGVSSSGPPATSSRLAPGSGGTRCASFGAATSTSRPGRSRFAPRWR